ncbi:MAG TPA: hypothetical protein VF974_08165 [Patescibacteria group bacterium]
MDKCKAYDVWGEYFNEDDTGDDEPGDQSISGEEDSAEEDDG